MTYSKRQFVRFSVFLCLLVLFGVVLGTVNGLAQEAAVAALTATPTVTPIAESADNLAKLDHLLTLAEYLPAGAPVYFAIQSDRASLDSLNTLLQDIQSNLPMEALTGGNAVQLREFLDTGARSLFGTDYTEQIRPWLGQSIGFSILSLDALLNDYGTAYESPVFSISAQITDREKAATFVERWLENNFSYATFETISTDTYTLYQPTADSAYIETYVLVTDDVLMITSALSGLPVDGKPAYSLRDDRHFVDAMDSLPADNYGFALYLDVPTISSFAIGSNYYDAQRHALYLPLIKAVDPVGIGGTVLDGRTLTLDASIGTGNLTPLKALGITPNGTVQIDPTFSRMIPPDAAMIIHGTQLSGVVDFASHNLPGVLNALTMQNPDDPAGAEATAVISEMTSNFSNLWVSLYTGLDLKTEWANWLSEDYLVFISPNTNYNPVDYATRAYTLPLNFGLVFQAVDPTISTRAIETLIRDLPLTLRSMGVRGFRFREEINNGALTLVVQVDNPYDYSDYEAWNADYEFAVAANGDALVLGTYQAVLSVLNNTGSTIPAYPDLQSYLLPNPSMVWYWDAANVAAMVPYMTSGYQPETGLLQSGVLAAGDGTASLTVNELGDTLIRFTLTLAEADTVSVNLEDTFFPTVEFESPTTFPTLPPPTLFLPTQVPTETFTPTRTITLTPTSVFETTTMLPLEADESQTESISVENSFDYWEYVGSQDAIITIEVTSEDFDTYIELYTVGRANELTLLTFNDDDPNGGTSDSAIRAFLLPDEGSYVILVRGFDESIAEGDYTITLKQDS